ncbi:MAG: hypothetical protein L0220_27275, partial [Acidobacteria bacterium]|nr:hypothetical protein [Acidobacteriota bacterium]
PYFRTRVMAAIREKRGGLEPFSFLRMWKASGSLVYSMVALVVMLAALTYFQSGSQTEGDSPDLTASLNANAREWAVFGPDTSVEDKMTYDQVLTDIYDNESEREDPDGNRR